ncbi:MAG TPA: amidohydrolase family protein [Acidimicrobiales bacterium]|nr:amidohydrolase family protein [Acidimicrobiales bacterium]
MPRDPSSVRAEIGHPVVDGDGHVVEPLPLVADYIRKVAGGDVADRFAGSSGAFTVRAGPGAAQRGLRPGTAISPWWALPTDARERATGFLPALLYERLDEVGIDFAVLYSSVGLATIGHPDAAIRTGSCRGLNTYLAEVLDGYGDRMTAAAAIPMHTPDEAIAELDHAVGVLGFKAAMLNSWVARPTEDGAAPWLDVLALDSLYDYDPVWRRCVELGVAVTVHTPSVGIGLRQSSTTYMFNHIGQFSAGSEAFAKAVVFGGVLARFPTLTFAFLEGGAAWGAMLLADLVGRWEKRGGPNIERLDPRRVDEEEWDRLVDAYGGARFADPSVRAVMRAQSDNPPEDVDDFRATGARDEAGLVELFQRFYFGCEADDTMTAWAYATDVNPCRATLRPMLGSDIGHWDVTDTTLVLGEAYELVERGLLTLEQFREFACDNCIRLHGSMNPRFFDGTRVEGYARALLGSEARPASG